MHLYNLIPWLGSLAFEIVLIYIILKRGIYKRFPIFFGYVLFDIIRAIVLPIILYSNWLIDNYFYAYWICVPIEYTLTFFIILEVFAYTFRSHIKYSPKVIKAFLVFGLALLILSVVMVLRPDIPMNKLTSIILMVNRSVSLLMAGLFFFMWTYSSRIGFTMRDHVWGIVFGFGVYSSVSLLVAAIHATTGQMCPGWITPLPHFAYLSSTLIWNAFLFREEPEIVPIPDEQLEEYHGLIRTYRILLANVRKVLAR